MWIVAVTPQSAQNHARPCTNFTLCYPSYPSLCMGLCHVCVYRSLAGFLRRDVNKAFAEVTGQKVNRGAGYGLEIPYTYRLYGPPAYVNRMQEIV